MTSQIFIQKHQFMLKAHKFLDSYNSSTDLLANTEALLSMKSGGNVAATNHHKYHVLTTGIKKMHSRLLARHKW